MIMRLIVLLAALAVAGCQTTEQAPLPPIAVSGPTFAETRFDCGTKPVPPDPNQVGAKGGSAAAHYENRLATWGQHCSNELRSVSVELKAAGQVVDALANAERR